MLILGFLFHAENGGCFQEYLVELASANDVQKFVKKHPFGQRPITNLTPCWKFYKQVIRSINNSRFHYQREQDFDKDQFTWL
jgi:hypothetical protein